VLGGNFLEHVKPQSMPAGLLMTVPPPVPAFVTVRSRATNVAVTDLPALIVTLQVPVPVQAPLHPAKRLLV
jgi:hypothetical protein